MLVRTGPQLLVSDLFAVKKKRKQKITPFGGNVMRSQVLYQAAQDLFAVTALALGQI